MKKKILYCLMFLLIIMNLCYIISDNFEKNNSYIILDKNNVWKINNNNNNIKKTNKKILKKLNFSEISICEEECQKVYFNNDTYFEMYNENLEKTKFPSSYIKKIGEIEIKNYEEESNDNLYESEKELIFHVLKEKNLNNKLEDLYIKKIKLENKVFYSITPHSSQGPSQDIFSLIFLSEDSNYKIIYKNEKISRLSYLDKIVNIGEDDLIEIILLSDVPGSAGNECYSLYQYDKSIDVIKTVIDCEGK